MTHGTGALTTTETQRSCWTPLARLRSSWGTGFRFRGCVRLRYTSTKGAASRVGQLQGVHFCFSRREWPACPYHWDAPNLVSSSQYPSGPAPARLSIRPAAANPQLPTPDHHLVTSPLLGKALLCSCLCRGGACSHGVQCSHPQRRRSLDTAVQSPRGGPNAGTLCPNPQPRSTGVPACCRNDGCLWGMAWVSAAVQGTGCDRGRGDRQNGVKQGGLGIASQAARKGKG